MFGFLKALGRSSRRIRSTRTRPISFRPFLKQLGGASFSPLSGGPSHAFRPRVQALEERQLLSGFTGVTFGHPPPPVQLQGVQPQQLSNMSSVRDFYGCTYFFQMNSDQTVSYRSDNDPSGTWHNLGVKALSVSAGRDAGGDAVVYIIALDHSVAEYQTGSVWPGMDGPGWKNLGGWAYSISATQGWENEPGLLYAIGSTGHLYVNSTDFNTGWVWLGSPVVNGQHINSLYTISALSDQPENAPARSVCYATDGAGDVYEFTLQDPTSLQKRGSWSSMLGTNVAQIAASFDSNGNPIVYALSYANGYYGTVWVWDGSWHDLGGSALEISASRDRAPGTAGGQNAFYEIAWDHSVRVYNNAGSMTWGNGYWENLGGYATALTAEAAAVYPDSIDQLFADISDRSAYDCYGGSWHGLLGQQLNTSYTPLT
jgi:hypothetical protein